MTKAEEKALEVYPPHLVGDPTFPYGQWDVHGLERRCYQEGYEQAEKDTLERAIEWLRENANKYIVDIGVGYGGNGRNVELIVGGMCWEDLKKAMEDEK